MTKKSSFASLQDRANLLYAIYTEIIRKILDTAENVNDAIKIFKKYSLHNIVVPLHYLVSDATGNSVIIEYMNGAVEVQDLNQTSKMLTNFKYYSSQNDIANKTKEYLATGKILKDVSMKKKSMYGDFYTVLLRWNSGFDVSNSISLPDAGVALYLKIKKTIKFVPNYRIGRKADTRVLYKIARRSIRMISNCKGYATTRLALNGLALIGLVLVIGLSACQNPTTPIPTTPTTPTVTSYSVTYDGNGSISGAVPVDSNAYVTGASVTVLSPGTLVFTGHSFLGWATSATASAAEYQSDASFAMPASNLTLYAVWSLDQFTLKYCSRSGGSIEGVQTQTVGYGSSGSAVTAVVASDNYVFASWSDGVLTASRTDANVTADSTLIASFTYTGVNPNIEITVNYTAGSNGSITGTSAQTLLSGQSSSIVTAVPATGYVFTGWNDGVTTASRTDGPLYEDLSVTANFEITTITLTYRAGAHGSLSGPTTQTIDYLDDGTTVTAVPDAGYSFVGWNDGFNLISRTDSDVVKDVSVTALFSKNQLVVIDFSAIKDEIIDISADADRTISIGNGESMLVSIAGTWDSIEWHLNGATSGASGPNYTVFSNWVSVGVHTLTVVATRNGVPYSTMLRFRAVY